MLINPGARQRVAGFEAQEGEKERRGREKKDLFLLFSVSLHQFIPVLFFSFLAVPASRVSGMGVCGERTEYSFEFGFVLSLSEFAPPP